MHQKSIQKQWTSFSLVSGRFFCVFAPFRDQKTSKNARRVIKNQGFHFFGLDRFSVSFFMDFYCVLVAKTLPKPLRKAQQILIVFLIDFGPILAPRPAPWGGGVDGLTFSSFFQLCAVFGPKCLQELPQEPPEPPQASMFTDCWELFCQIFVISDPGKCRRA